MTAVCVSVCARACVCARVGVGAELYRLMVDDTFNVFPAMALLN